MFLHYKFPYLFRSHLLYPQTLRLSSYEGGRSDDFTSEKRIYAIRSAECESREAYGRVLDGGLRKWLIHGGAGDMEVVSDDEAILVELENKNDKVELVEVENEEDEKRGDSRSKRSSKRFNKGGRNGNVVDGDDDEYFENLERGDFYERGLKVIKTKEEDKAEEGKTGREFLVRMKGKLLFSAMSSR